MGVTVQIYLRRLLRKTNADIALIAEQAEKVVAGNSSSISTLSQSASFDMASAGRVLEAVELAQTMRENTAGGGTPENCGPDRVSNSAGHVTRFSGSTTWGC